MNVSLYQAASALNANSRWQELITENMASSMIPGYKKQELSFSAVQSGLMQPTGLGPTAKFTLPKASISTDFAPGELEMTSNKTDMALDGPGFFVVQMSNGSKAYTRDGQFQINASGQLTTLQGNLVMGETGPIQLDMNNKAPLTVSETGEVSQGSEVKGKLQVVDFQQPQLLTPAGAGLFVAQNSSLVPTPVTKPGVRQGFVEMSNASSVTSMASLITVMRGYEANQRVIQLQDERMNKAITDLGNPS